jgi:hypothetical protein
MHVYSSNYDYTAEDDSRDIEFFTLMLDLLEWNNARYKSQAEQLLRDKFLEVDIDGRTLCYKLDRVGCSYWFSNKDKTVERTSWNRFGIRKSRKREALPGFFARSEADFNLNS